VFSSTQQLWSRWDCLLGPVNLLPSSLSFSFFLPPIILESQQCCPELWWHGEKRGIRQWASFATQKTHRCALRASLMMCDYKIVKLPARLWLIFTNIWQEGFVFCAMNLFWLRIVTPVKALSTCLVFFSVLSWIPWYYLGDCRLSFVFFFRFNARGCETFQGTIHLIFSYLFYIHYILRWQAKANKHHESHIPVFQIITGPTCPCSDKCVCVCVFFNQVK